MRLVKAKELAAMMKVGISTAYQWAALGQIPSVRIGRSIRFDLDAIEAQCMTCQGRPPRSYNPVTQARSPKKGV